MGIPLAIYGSHDSSVCITPSPGKFRIYEFERLLRKRNCAITKEPDFREHMVYLRGLIETEYGFSSYGSCFFAQVPAEHRVILKEVFGFDHFEEISHHAAHAAGAVYQCDHEECLVISSDSGGHEMEGTIATFCIFLADKKKPMNHVIKKIADIPLDLAGAYTLMAVPIAEIQKTDAFTKYLTYAGKIMGLAAYGAIRMNWIEPLKRYYYGNINLDSLKRLGEEIGLNLSGINTLSGQPAYDLAATSQRVFEEITFTTIRPFVRKYQLPVVLTGGAALNVLLNEKFRKNLGRPVFVPINPNDCGLSFGLMALREPPEGAVDLTYMGFDILDRSDFADYIDRYNGRMSIPSD
ncbi:MAG TPA: hypothetical protein VEA58_02740, partial [Anaerovoracaceae bacterium]|nr:hypothetical protein [Anaerovoracaceae bacterium]